MSAADLLARLDRVHQCAPDRWRAVCPAHESRHRTQSLAIHELPDGTVLLKCFAGCGAVDVVGALGLQLRDLFPARPGHHYPAARFRVPAAEVLALLDHEVVVALLILQDVVEHRAIDDQDWSRLAQAADRISQARNHAAPAKIKADAHA